MYHLSQEIKRHYMTLALICTVFIAISSVLHLTNGLEWASMSVVGIQQGEIWRLITAHLTHLDRNHLFMNMLGLNMCMVVFRDDVKAIHWVASFIFISIFSSLCMYFAYFNYDRYVGFSDVLHGWILVGAACIAHKEPKLTIMIFILFWAKIIEENINLEFFTTHGAETNVAHESHIYGAWGGVLYSLLFVKSFRNTLLKMVGAIHESPK